MAHHVMIVPWKIQSTETTGTVHDRTYEGTEIVHDRTYRSVVPISEDTGYDHGNYPSMVQSLLRAWTVRGDHGRCSFRCALVRSVMDDTAET